MKLTVLGSGGWIPTHENETACYMIETEKALILLDAGTGVSNLSSYQDVIRRYDTLHIVLSHYHFDHVIGLSYLPMLFNKHQIWIHGPGAPAYPAGVKEILNSFFSEPFAGSSAEELTEHMHFADYTEGPFMVENVSFQAFPQHHAHPSYGLKVENLLYYASDTSLLEATFQRAEGVKMLLHECWDLERVEESFHTSLEEILATIPSKVNYQVGLIHRNPRWGLKELAAAQEKINSRNIKFMEDYQYYEL